MWTLPVRPFGIVLLALLIAAAGCSSPTPTPTPVPIGGYLSDAALGLEPTPTASLEVARDARGAFEHGYADGKEYACAHAEADSMRELRALEDEEPKYQAKKAEAMQAYSGNLRQEYEDGYEDAAWDVLSGAASCGWW